MEAEPELTKYPTTADPAKMATMQVMMFVEILFRVIFSQFTEDQMSRYESFSRSALQKGNMRKGNDTRNDVSVALKHEPLSFVCFLDMQLLQGVTGSQKISMPITIVTCGIAKIFVGELVETGKDWPRVVMGERSERNDSGPIRPCHIKGSYQMLDPISVNMIMGHDRGCGPQRAEAHSEYTSSRRRFRGPRDRGDVTKITVSTHYKERGTDMKKGTLKTLERDLHFGADCGAITSSSDPSSTSFVQRRKNSFEAKRLLFMISFKRSIFAITSLRRASQ
ncbi:hypothetical protein YC2023_042924 [Brassica napus]